MPTAKDVAQYILEKRGITNTIKLQKLVYYCQAWSLVWDEAPIFDDPIEAWANGPVVPNLFFAHQGKFNISTIKGGSSSFLNKDQKESVDAVLEYYGEKTSQWLVDLTHLEDPWKNARGDAKPGERCNNIITHSAMAEYYSGL